MRAIVQSWSSGLGGVAMEATPLLSAIVMLLILAEVIGYIVEH